MAASSWADFSETEPEPEETKTEEESTDVDTVIPKNLVFMRGLPGSGKTVCAHALARDFNSRYPGCKIRLLTGDDYFMVTTKNNKKEFKFDGKRLGQAREWNERRCKRAIADGCDLIIIDHCHIRAHEAMNYIAMADEAGYLFRVQEPQTEWKRDVNKCTRLTPHGFDWRVVAAMHAKYEECNVARLRELNEQWR